LEPKEGKYSNNKYFVQQTDRIIGSRGQWLNLSRNSGLRSGLLGCTIRLIPAICGIALKIIIADREPAVMGIILLIYLLTIT
jgi:hypothetical protein